jgi:hypothetical protein
MRLCAAPLFLTLVTTLFTLTVTAAPAARGETKPDFSGTWIFNPAKSKLEIDPPTKSIFVIEHRDPKFSLSRTHTWGEESDAWIFDSTTDGKEHYQKDGEFESWSRLTWMGEELILEMKVVYGGEEGTNVVHYRLAEGGKTFVAAEWFHLPSHQHHNLWIFDRKPEK